MADPAYKVTVVSASDYYADRDLPPTPSVYSPDRAHFADSSFPQRNPSLSRARPQSPRSASILDLDKKAMVKRRISQLEPHRPDAQSRGRIGSELRRRGSTRSTGSDSLLEFYSIESPMSETGPHPQSAWPAPSLALIPEVASVSQVSEPPTVSVSPSLTNPGPSVDAGEQLAPLVELLQDQATKHYYHTNDLKDQIASLNNELHTMFQELKVAIGEQPVPDVSMLKFEEALDKTFASLEPTVMNLRGNDDGTADLKRKLDAVHDQIKTLDVGERSSAMEPNPICQAVLEKLETLRMEIKNLEGFPGDAVGEITKLREALNRLSTKEIETLNNVGKSQEPATEDRALDLSGIYAKLDELVDSLKSQLTTEPTTPKVEIPEVRSVASQYRDPV